MPRKLREIRADLRKAVFVLKRQVGSHEQWHLPTYKVDRVTLSGNDGSDAKPYQERELRRILLQLRTLEIEDAR